MDESVPPYAATADASDRSLEEDLRQLASEARAFAAAEVAYQKSRAAFAGQQARSIALLGLLAAVLVFFALMALTVGLVIALTPLITAWGATAAVFGGLLIAAAICALLAFRTWKRMMAALSNETD
jgi:uncharacterized membrane protein YqjE